MAARNALLSLGAAAVAAGAIVALPAGAAAPAPCPASASLRLLDSSPVTFEGIGFCGRERLRVRARTDGVKRTRRVTAGLGGRFTVRFRTLSYDPCTSDLHGSARGSDGLRASLKRPQKQCPPPASPQGGSAPAPTEPAPSDPYAPQDPCTGADGTPGGKPGPQPQCPLP